MLRALSVVCWALVCQAIGAEPRWIHLNGGEIDVYSSADEVRSREVLGQFEAARGFFSQLLGDDGHGHTPACIVVFGSAKEWEARRANKFAVAYYQPGFTCDYIVLRPTATDQMSVALHEYVHLIVRNRRLRLPVWLNEGLAELYSTIRPQGDKILVGTPVPHRLQALRAGRWAPLASILAAGRDSAYYNEKDKADQLYNEGWALTHMLSLSDDYRAGFQTLLAEIRGGTESAEALHKVYGKSVDQIEDDLRKYADNYAFRGMLMPASLVAVPPRGDAEAVEPYRVSLVLTDIDYRPERGDEIRHRFSTLAAESPERPEAHQALGMLAEIEQHPDEAVAHLTQAYELGARNSRLLWDLGRLLESRNPAQAVAVLTPLLEREPGRADVRVVLAMAQLHLRQAPTALRTLTSAKSIDTVDAVSYFWALARVSLANLSANAAGAAARRMAELARTPAEKEEAERLLAFIAAAVRPAAAPAAAATESEPGTLNPGPPAVPSEARRTALEGSLVEFQCLGRSGRMVLEVAGRRRVFAVDDLAAIGVAGSAAGAPALACGPQRPRRVRIEFALPGPAHKDIDGVVEAVRFEP